MLTKPSVLYFSMFILFSLGFADAETKTDSQPWYPTGPHAYSCTLASNCVEGFLDSEKKIEQHKECYGLISQDISFTYVLSLQNTYRDIYEIGLYYTDVDSDLFCTRLERLLPIPEAAGGEGDKKYNPEKIWDSQVYDYFCTIRVGAQFDGYTYRDRFSERSNSKVMEPYCRYLEKLIVTTTDLKFATRIDGYQTKEDQIERETTYVFFCYETQMAMNIRGDIRNEINTYDSSIRKDSKNITGLLCNRPDKFYQAMSMYENFAGSYPDFSKFQDCMREALKECIKYDQETA